MDIKGESEREKWTFCRSQRRADHFIPPDYSGMARMPGMLSNLHHSCHNNDLKPRSMNFITSISIQSARQASWRKHNTCHIRAFDLSMTISFIHSSSPSQTPGVRQQSKSIATAPRMCCFSGEVNLTGVREKHNSSALYARLLINFPAGQVRGGGGEVYRLYPPLSQMRNNVLYSITL